VFAVRHHDGAVTRHLPNPMAAIMGASMAYAAAVDQDLHCATCPAGWAHIAHGRIDTCRYCGHEVVLGKHGWRLDTNRAGGEACQAAPRGYHGVDKPGRPQ
jgi:hypothetical protein